MFLVVRFDLSSTYRLNFGDLNRTTQLSCRESFNCRTAVKDN